MKIFRVSLLFLCSYCRETDIASSAWCFPILVWIRTRNERTFKYNSAYVATFCFLIFCLTSVDSFALRNHMTNYLVLPRLLLFFEFVASVWVLFCVRGSTYYLY